MEYFYNGDYDAIVLDIMMPEMNGLQVLENIRKGRSGIPIMMLTAKGEIEDRVAGLEAGADDYLPKPFSTREFVARVKALVRRNDNYAGSILSLGNVQLDCNRYELSSGIRPENLYDPKSSKCNKAGSEISAKVNVCEPLGAETYLYFDLEGFPMTARVDADIIAKPGETAKFVMDMDKVHIFDKETGLVITN